MSIETTSAAIDMARAITRLIPPKPAPNLFGLGKEPAQAANAAYGAATAGAVAAWQYAAHIALNQAANAAPDGWVIDTDNHNFIDGIRSIPDLEAMCDPAYRWSGRRTDQC